MCARRKCNSTEISMNPFFRCALARRSLLSGAFIALALSVAGGAAQAGPLRLLLRGDARDFGDDDEAGVSLAQNAELPALTATGDAPLLAAQPASLARWHGANTGENGEGNRFSRALVEARYNGEFTYRRTRGAEITRVASSGVQLTALWKPAAKWGAAISAIPSEVQDYVRRTDTQNTDLDGDFDSFSVAVGHQLNRRTALGVLLARTHTAAPLKIDAVDLGQLVPDVTRLDFGWDETRALLQVERQLDAKRRLRLTAGALNTDFSLNVDGQPLNSGAQFGVRLPITGGGWVAGARYRENAGRGEWIAEINHEQRNGKGILRLTDGQTLGEGDANYRETSARLVWRRPNPRGEWNVGLEHLSGHADAGFFSKLRPLFPNDPLLGSGEAQARVGLYYRSTLLRAGYEREFQARLRGRAGLAFGSISAGDRADAQALVLFGLGGFDYIKRDNLGPRLSLIPALGLSYGGQRVQLRVELAQYIPLPETKSRARANPNSTSAKPRAQTFGGTLAVVSLGVPF